MAIQAAFTMDNGAQGSFWQITNINVDVLAGQVHYIMQLYLDAAHAQSNNPLGEKKYFSVAISDPTQDLLTLGYSSVIGTDADLVAAQAVQVEDASIAIAQAAQLANPGNPVIANP